MKEKGWSKKKYPKQYEPKYSEIGLDVNFIANHPEYRLPDTNSGVPSKQKPICNGRNDRDKIILATYAGDDTLFQGEITAETKWEEVMDIHGIYISLYYLHIM